MITACAYAYAISVDGVVRYIGKGKNDRVKQHLRKARNILRRREAGEKVRASIFYNRLAKGLRGGARIKEEIIEKGMTEAAALKREVEIIASFPAGQLWNRNAGGSGPSSETATASWADPLVRAKRERAARLRDNSASIASNRNPIIVSKRIATLRETWAKPDAQERKRAASIKTWQSADYRERISAARRSKWADPIYKEKMCLIRKEQWERRRAVLNG